MKNKISIIVSLFILVIFLTSCSQTANIGWEGVNVKLLEYSKVPKEYTNNSLEIMRLKVSGSPRDHYYASQILEVMEFLDSKGSSCGLDILEGFDTDILLVGSGDISFLIDCDNTEGERNVIFRNSAEELLDSISAKWKITPSENPSNKAKTLLDKWETEATEQAKAIKEQEEKIKAEQAEKVQKINELQKEYNKLMQECLNSNEGMNNCLNNENNLDEINEIKERYNNCISDPNKYVYLNGGICWEFMDIFNSGIEGNRLVYTLKPNHNGENILNDEINKILEKQKYQCETENSNQNYCEKKANEELCTNNEYCGYIEKQTINDNIGYS